MLTEEQVVDFKLAYLKAIVDDESKTLAERNIALAEYREMIRKKMLNEMQKKVDEANNP